MSTGEAPAPVPSEQVTASPPAPEPTTAIQPLQPTPLKPILAPEGFVRRLRLLDLFVIVLVAAFALQSGLFRAFNSDVFLHLAAGRGVAEGQPFAGPDPFTFTADWVWVNHSWLPDLVAYKIYQFPRGDAALVVLKALAVALLAFVLARAGAIPGRPLWIPAVCTLLAVLALSPRLLLQSTVLSYVMLGITLLLLRRAGEGKGSPWLLPLVCLVWVNLDGWFLLGPAAIALFVLGEWLQFTLGDDHDPQKKRRLITLGLALVASVAACLVNPYHVRAFTLPVALDFSETVSVLGRDNQFRAMFLAPWEGLYFHKRIGLSAAGLSYFLLLAVGVVSFAVTAPAWRWWRVLVWLAFAGLSLWNYRTIPFFAVVAGPITALNLLDGVARFLGVEVRGDLQSRQLAIAGRVLTCAVLLVLALVSVPGFLQAEPHAHRQFGVGIHVDRGLREAAERLAAWREEGALAGETRYFNTAPEVVNYFAWFCPGEKGFFDHRVNVFPADRARDYLAARKALSGEQLPGEDEKQQRRPPAWRKVFSAPENRIDFVVFYSPEMNFAPATLQRLYGDPKEFVPCHISGSTAIFAWRKPESAPLDARLPLRPEERAFGKDPYLAPPGRVVSSQARPWYREFLPAPQGSTRERDTAWQYREWFDAMQRPYAEEMGAEFTRIGRTTATGLSSSVGMAADPTGMGPLAAAYQFRFAPEAAEQLLLLFNDRDRGPAAALYLAVRHLRHARNEEGSDPLASLVLAQTYAQLQQKTREAARAQRFPLASSVRQVQTMAALRAALDAEPRPDVARTIHVLMADALRSPVFLESKVRHLEEYIKLTKQLGPVGGVTPRQFREMLEAAEKELKKEQDALKERQNLYAINSAMKKPLEKIQVALQNGLSDTALKVLDESAKEVGPDGAHRALDLYLGLGKVKEAREILYLDEDDEEERVKRRRTFGAYLPGLPAYDWFAFLASAASGDYRDADRILEESGEVIRERKSKEPWLWNRFPNLQFDPEIERAQRLSELSCLRGLVALESGQLALAAQQARLSLRQSLALESAKPLSQGSRPLAELIVELAEGKKKP